MNCVVRPCAVLFPASRLKFETAASVKILKFQWKQHLFGHKMAFIANFRP